MRKVVHPEFPEYFIRDDGRIERRVDSKRYQKAGEVLEGRVLCSGYRQHKLVDRNGVKRLVRTNRLICEAFHGPPPTAEHHAAHKNGVRLDNQPDNLEWATPLSNMRDRSRHGTQARGRTAANQYGKSPLTDEAVREIRASYSGSSGEIAELAIRYGMSHTGMSNIVHGRTWRHVPNDPRRHRR